MAALGDGRMLSKDDKCTILDLYMGANSICKVPLSTAEGRGDDVTGSTASNIASAKVKEMR